MKLIELFADKLANSALMEMAFERKKALQVIRGVSSQLARHMILLAHCDDHECEHHWETEVNNFLTIIKDHHTFLKKRTRLSIRDLEDDLWDGPLGEYEDYTRVLSMLEKAKGMKFSPPTEDIYQALKNRYKKMITMLLQKYDVVVTYKEL